MQVANISYLKVMAYFNSSGNYIFRLGILSQLKFMELQNYIGNDNYSSHLLLYSNFNENSQIFISFNTFFHSTAILPS